MPRKKKKKKHSFFKQRDSFYKNHPYAKALIGLFIVATTVLVGTLYYRYRIHVEVGTYLWEEEGIQYNPNL